MAMRLLLVEDNPGDARLVREMCREQGLPSEALALVDSISGAEAHLVDHEVDLILLDLGLPDAHGLDALRRAQVAAPRVPLVVLTGLDDEAIAVQALQQGAQDYLIKGQLETRGLMRALRYAIERKVMEEALFVEKELAVVTLNSIGDAVISTDITGTIALLNLVAEKMTGWSTQEAAGHPVADVFRILDATTREISPDAMEAAVRNDCTEHLPSNSLLIRRDGHEIPIDNSVSPIHDRQGHVTGAVIVFRDVSAAREMALRMAHSAEHDFLTGLPNRMLLNDRLGQAIAMAARHSTRVAVLFLDLDGFKRVNDSLGHPIGDRLLQSVAGRLAACVRASDTVSRQGGDEFVVLLPEAGQWEDAATVARRMLLAVAETHTLDQRDLHITTSVGVSIYPDDGANAETLIRNADMAMYQAKENGRNGYQFFMPEMNVRAVERRSIEEGLRRALEQHEFVLHYQPKVNLATGAISGAEALIRWRHPTEGLVSPARFIPVAEESGLILQIGNWVLREACRQARAWADEGLPGMTIAVNVSAIELRDASFLEGLFRVLGETGLDPRNLEVEITESVLMRNAESAAAILLALRGRGVRVSVDDFGTGYSSLSYLQKFAVDALKIDQSFVSQIASAQDEASIVTAVISMSRSLKLRVIAEGVETLEQLAFLQAHDCDEAQGYFFSRPVPPQQFAELLRTGIRAADIPFGASEGTPVDGMRRRSSSTRLRSSRAISAR
jgi:diguanylate cyclase (GGDEF)-like protein/PAS domain S-box-containing protein